MHIYGYTVSLLKKSMSWLLRWEVFLNCRCIMISAWLYYFEHRIGVRQLFTDNSLRIKSRSAVWITFWRVWLKMCFAIAASEFADFRWKWKHIDDLHQRFFCSLITSLPNEFKKWSENVSGDQKCNEIPIWVTCLYTCRESPVPQLRFLCPANRSHSTLKVKYSSQNIFGD